MRLALLPVLALVVLGCSARSPTPPSGTADAAVALDGPVLCIPGAQFACACAGSAAGVQVCGPDGRALGPCSCPTTDAGALPLDAPDVTPRSDVADVPAPDTGCSVGDEQPCVCPSWFGTQTCSAAGWGACVCPMDAATSDVVDAAQAPDAPDVADTGGGPEDVGTPDAVDPLSERRASLSIEVRLPSRTLTNPRASTCTLASNGTISFGAEFCPVGPGACEVFAGTLPASGPQLLTRIFLSGQGASDVRSITERGATYSAGSAIRVNVRVTGSPPLGGAGDVVVVTVLGCSRG